MIRASTACQGTELDRGAAGRRAVMRSGGMPEARRGSRRIGAPVRAAAVLALAALSGLGGAARAAPETIACPLRVVSDAATVVDVEKIAGFRPAFHGGSAAYLVGIGVFEGPVSDGVELASAPAGRGMRQWTFEAVRKPPTLVCRYEGGISLLRPSPKGASACVAATQASGAKDSQGVGLDYAVFACQ